MIKDDKHFSMNGHAIIADALMPWIAVQLDLEGKRYQNGKNK